MLACSGCDIINPAEPVPAYVRLQSPEILITNPGTQGTASENITNTWAYLDNNPLGVFNRTGTFPVIGEGEHKITCIAGIMENGISSVRVTYPFYTPDTTIAVLTPNGDLVISPQYKYISGTMFALNEGFEIGSAIELWNGSTAELERVTGADVFEGAYAARIQLTDSFNFFDGRTTQILTLPTDGSSIYLELNYKTDVTLQVGLLDMASGETSYQWNISPKTSWNKIYLNLRDAVLSSGSSTFRLLFRATKPSTLQSGNVFLDNVKLVHF